MRVYSRAVTSAYPVDVRVRKTDNPWMPASPATAARVLVLLREGQSDDLNSLRSNLGAGATPYLNAILDELQRAGLVAKEPPECADWQNVKIRATAQLELIQHALGISLRQITAASDDTVFVTPFFGQPPESDQPSDVFVLMPFSEHLRPVYQDHIANVAKELGVSVKRADDVFGTGHVMADVWSGIWGARAIIADCTGRNPNVFYEIGVAHTVGRPVILITQEREDVPFDLRAIRYLQYEFTPRGMVDFERRLRETLRAVLSPVSLNLYDTYLTRSTRAVS